MITTSGWAAAAAVGSEMEEGTGQETAVEALGSEVDGSEIEERTGPEIEALRLWVPIGIIVGAGSATPAG